MIKKTKLQITSPESFDQLSNHISPPYINDKIIAMLKNNMVGKVGTIIIEDPYYDADYLSTFYSFYAKKHKKFKKENVRLHFFAPNAEPQKAYLGYITLRPTIENTTLGKSYLSPQLFLPKGCRLITNDFKTHILGHEELISAFPWMQQETDVAVCAHVAIWSILRYFGTKYPNYHNITMGNVVEKLPEDIERKVPTLSVSIQKIPDIFKIMGFSPIVVSKAIVGEERFQREMIAYIDSGIPIVGCMTEKKHAISIIGYESDTIENIKKSLDNSSSIIYNNKIVRRLIVNDDNFHPYLLLRKKEDFNPLDDAEDFSKQERFIEDIDFLIVPLYDRMQYNYSSLRETVSDFLKENEFLHNEQYIMKTYITSSNSLKEHAAICIDNFDLSDTIIRMTMPRFVWCVDFSTIDEFENNHISARLIIDTTSCNRDHEPWLLMHNNHYIKYLDENEWKEMETNISSYERFDNLEEVI